MSYKEFVNVVEKTLLNGDFGTNGEVVSCLLIMVVSLVLILSLIILFLLVLDIIGKWKMFKKAGEAGWKALIPIYNKYTQCRITGINTLWVFILLICCFVAVFFKPFKYVCEVVTVYFSIILSISIARSYGKTDGFGVGIFLLSPVFNMILGFDNSEYKGISPVGDLLDFTKKEKAIVKEDSSIKTVKDKTTDKKKTNVKKEDVSKEKETKKSTTAKKSATNKKTTTAKKSTSTKKTTSNKKTASPKKKNSTKKKTTQTKKNTKK